MAHGARALIALLAFAGACGGETSAPAPPSGEASGEAPAEAPEPPPACETGRLEEMMGAARARGGLAVRGGWIAALDDVLRVRGPTGHTYAVTEGRMARLLGVAELGGGPLVLALGVCEEDARCLLALDPSTSDAALTVPLPGEPETTRRAITEGAMLLAWSAPGGARRLERFARAGGGIVHESIPLGDGEASAEAPTEILAMAAHEDTWAVVWRRGATEGASSHVFITRPGAHRASEALHDVLTVESIALDGDGLALIASFEFSRPGFARFTEGDPELRLLPPDAPIPAPLTERGRAELDIDDRGLWLLRRSPAGDALGAPARVIAGTVEMASLERRGDAYHVVWAAPDRRILAREVRCD